MTHQNCGLCSTDSRRQYLPLVDIEAHTTILETISRTRLTQTFFNPPENGDIQELQYTFPLYDGVSIVGFACHIGDRTIVGIVEEREKAKKEFKDAVSQGKKTALLEQLPSSSDIFTTTIGNISSGAEVIIEISYIGELMHDAEVNGIRFTIPTTILPRYGDHPVEIAQGTVSEGRIQITVDVAMAAKSVIQQIQSPSHPIAVSIGTTSIAPGATPVMSKASATLSLSSAELDKDFVVQVVAKDMGVPTAILETHPTIPNQRAIMATLVPRFSLPPEKPEIVFICDRSGSMEGESITLAKSALRVFMKSLPVGIKFNICSFGDSHSFMWDKSQLYTQENLNAAIRYVDAIQANMGGTEMYDPIKATIERRYKDIPLEIMLLTDGAVWNHQKIFNYLNGQVIENKASIRVFTLGVGSGVSHALIRGVAKSGNGFAQTVGQGEKMEGKVVRMLKGALSPHVVDYTLELKYSGENRVGEVNDEEEEFVMVERVADSLNVKLDLVGDLKDKFEPPQQEQKPTSLYDATVDIDKEKPDPPTDINEERYLHLPSLTPPKLLQTPHIIPPLYTFDRTNIYLLIGPECNQLTPSSVVLRGTSKHGLLELEIPIQVLDTPSETIHQLAAKKAISELEQGRGWITQAKDEDGLLIKSKFESQFTEMTEREAVRLGVQFQVQGKWTSFVAIEAQRADDTPTQDRANNATSQTPTRDHKEVTAPTLHTGDNQQRPTVSSSLSRRQELEMKRMRLAEIRRSRESRDAAPATREPTTGRVADGLVLSLIAAKPCSLRMSDECDYEGNSDESDCEESDSDDGCSEESDSDDSDLGIRRNTASYHRLSANTFLIGDDDGDDNDDDDDDDNEAFKAIPMRKKKKKASCRLGMDDEDDGGVVATMPRLDRSKLEILIDLQTFQGSWDWDQILFDCIVVTATDAEKVAKDNGWDENVVVTALAILFFEKKLAEEKDTWELVVDKARGWLEEQIGEDGIVAVLQEATKLYA